MNDSLYNYLVNNCGGKVKVLDNGVYQVNTGAYQFYMNPNSAQDVNLVVYYSGGDGARSDLTRGLRGKMSDPNPSNYVTIIANQTDDGSNVLDVATKILNDNGYNITSLVTTSNSASGGLGISRTADYLTQHPELADSTLILCNDGYYMNQTGKNSQILIDNQVPIVMLAPDQSVATGGSNRVRAFNKSLSEKGFNVYQLESKDYVHDIICTYAYTNGIPDYVLGLQDELGTAGSHCAPEYVLYKYNTQTGQYELANMEDMKIASSFKDIGTNLIDPNTYRDVTYKLDTSLGAGNNSTLASDLGVVMDSMNDLSSVVKSNSFPKASNGCASTVPLVGLLYDSQNYLFGVSSTLADNIGRESAVIANIAQAIYNMDVNLSKNTNGLNDPVNAQKVNATLDKILQSDITIPYASFASPVTFEKVSQGKAGKLCMSDIKSMLSGGKLSGSLANGFETDNADTQKTIDSIKSFQEKIASNTSLQGDIWKEVNAKLDNYKGLLDKRLASNDKLKSAYEEALKLLEDYMGDYDELDDAKIPELKTQVANLEAEIKSLQAKIDEMKEVCDTDSEGKSTNCHMEHVYSDSARAEFAAQIKKNEELIVELNKEIEKLEGLWEVINKAADIVNGAVDEIKADYAKDVQDVAVAAPEQVLNSTEQQTGVTPVDTSAQTGTTPAGNTGVDTSGGYGGYSGGGGGYSGGGGGYGGYSGGSIGSTETTKPPTSNTTTFETAVQHNAATTNAPESNTVTESNTTTTPVEQNTPQQNQTIINNYYYNNNGGGGGGSHSEPAPIVQTNEPVLEETIEEPVVEEIVEEPVVEEVIEEPIIEEDIPIEEPEEENVIILGNTDVIETTATAQKSNSALKALGVMAGIGVAAGAAAYAAKEMKKSSNDSENEDYDYDSSTEGYY